MRRSLLAITAAALLPLGCGAAPTSSPPAPPAPVATVAAPCAGAGCAEPEPAPPERALASLADPDAELFVEAASLQRATAGLPLLAGLLPLAGEELGEALGLSADEAEALLQKIDGASYSVSGSWSSGGLTLLRLADPAPVIAWLRGRPRVEGHGAGALAEVVRLRGGAVAAWLPSQRALAVGPLRSIVALAERARSGEPGLAGDAAVTAARARLGGDPGFLAVLRVDPILEGSSPLGPYLRRGTSMHWVTRLGSEGMRSSFELPLADFPGAAVLSPPGPLTLADRLPAGTAGYVALSLGRVPGADLLQEFPVLRVVDEEMKEGLGLSLVQATRWLGEQVVLGFVPAAAAPADADADIWERGALVALADLADAKAAAAALPKLRDALRKPLRRYTLTLKGSELRADPKAEPGSAARPAIRLRLDQGRLVLLLGRPDAVDAASRAVAEGERTLASAPSHRRALAALPAGARARLWVDFTSAMRLGLPVEIPAEVPKDLAMATALRLDRAGSGWIARLDGVNGMEAALAAVAIHGVRRYIASAKVSEAKHMVGAITRSAAAAFEREQLGPGNTVVHALCKGAGPVPAQVPPGLKYQPSDRDGRDFLTGDDHAGWKCLKFNMTMPFYYQYEYRVGGPYKGPARGGPDPGPDGFEASAEGDIDGDGVTSLITRVGTVDRAAGVLTISTQFFIDNEYE